MKKSDQLEPITSFVNFNSVTCLSRIGTGKISLFLLQKQLRLPKLHGEA